VVKGTSASCNISIGKAYQAVTTTAKEHKNSNN